VVKLTWRDAHFEFSSDDAAAPPADHLVQTVGWVVAATPLFVSIAAEQLPDGTWRAVTHIPRAAIVQSCSLAEDPGKDQDR